MVKIIFEPSIETYIHKKDCQRIIHKIRYVTGDGIRFFYIEHQEGSIEAREI